MQCMQKPSQQPPFFHFKVASTLASKAQHTSVQGRQHGSEWITSNVTLNFSQKTGNYKHRISGLQNACETGRTLGTCTYNHAPPNPLQMLPIDPHIPADTPDVVLAYIEKGWIEALSSNQLPQQYAWFFLSALLCRNSQEHFTSSELMTMIIVVACGCQGNCGHLYLCISSSIVQCITPETRILSMSLPENVPATTLIITHNYRQGVTQRYGLDQGWLD
eukprot:scpid100540/ scgid21636/ 